VKTGATCSAIFHAAVMALAYWGLPWRDPINLESVAIPVTLVQQIDERTTAQRREEPKPQPKPEPPKPEPPKPEPPKPEPPKPEPPKPEPPKPEPPPPPAPPPPPPPPPPPRGEPKPEPKTEVKPQEVAEIPVPKPEAKVEPPKPEPPKPQPPQQVVRPPEPEPKKERYDFNKLAVLLDKTKPKPQSEETDKRSRSQQAPAASAAPSAASLADQLTMSEKDAIRAQIERCWSFDPGARDAQKLRVTVRFSLLPDGSVRGIPEIVDRARMNDPYFRAFAESAVRAVQKCSPLRDLPSRKYESWRDVELTFDPKEMLGG
jgi:outer membrane biosynthesis protein TonB